MADSTDSTEASSGATPEPAASASSSKPGKPAKERRGNPIARLGRFIREVVAELRKVIYPTRNELVTYTIVVVLFVTVMTAFVYGLDLGFSRVVLFVLGTPDSGDK